ncbi:mRNA decay activator protein ZFP36-like [Impatiens glandulifera]|uniref:mRNA decay activator protein ZFP36-like n=1 Tax=Impatiens glandulifera TaxID=253017 RepID=UPI001FB14AA3|nr:mRNA decay activator protein ZFP36-like [Impatiens glandulifera]
MEGFYSTTNQRPAKLNQQFFIGGNFPIDNTYMENVDLAMFKYLNSDSPSSPAAIDGFRTPILSEFPNHSPNINRSRTRSRCAPSLPPLSSVENFDTSLFKTPVKVEVHEEDVLVMDGILVGSRSSSKDRFSSSSESGGSSSSPGHNNFYKKDLCRSWEDLSQCRYGYKCQFAHGKEEMRPSRFICNNKSEAAKSKQHGGKGGIVHNQIINLETETTTLSPPSKYQSSPISIKSRNPESSIVSTDWCPFDDGISFVSAGSVSTNTYSSREDVNPMIMKVLYGPQRQQKRLPVFEEICSDK